MTAAQKALHKSVTEMYSVAERNKTEKSPPDEGPLVISHKGKSFIFTKTRSQNESSAYLGYDPNIDNYHGFLFYFVDVGVGVAVDGRLFFVVKYLDKNMVYIYV